MKGPNLTTILTSGGSRDNKRKIFLTNIKRTEIKLLYLEYDERYKEMANIDL